MSGEAQRHVDHRVSALDPLLPVSPGAREPLKVETVGSNPARVIPLLSYTRHGARIPMSGPNPDSKARIEGMRAYCLGKSGVEESLSLGKEHPCYIVIRGSGYTDFAMFRLDEVPDLLLVRCADDALRALNARHGAAIRKSPRMDWPTEGWTWAEALLDGSVPDVS